MCSERGLQMSAQTDCAPCTLLRDDQLPELHKETALLPEQHLRRCVQVDVRVMQLALSTTCAGFCPVAMKTAAARFAAWALNPPIEPAMADPIRFFDTFSWTMLLTSLFKTSLVTFAGTMALATMPLPRLLTQSKCHKHPFWEDSIFKAGQETTNHSFANSILGKLRRDIRPAVLGRLLVAGVREGARNEGMSQFVVYRSEHSYDSYLFTPSCLKYQAPTRKQMLSLKVRSWRAKPSIPISSME